MGHALVPIIRLAAALTGIASIAFPNDLASPGLIGGVPMLAIGLGFAALIGAAPKRAESTCSSAGPNASWHFLPKSGRDGGLLSRSSGHAPRPPRQAAPRRSPERGAPLTQWQPGEEFGDFLIWHDARLAASARLSPASGDEDVVLARIHACTGRPRRRSGCSSVTDRSGGLRTVAGRRRPRHRRSMARPDTAR